MNLTASEWIAVAGILATVLVGVASWVVSASLTRKSISRRILGYKMDVSPLMTTSLKSSGLKIEYKGEELQEPLLLTVEIFNLGNVALESPPISIATARGATYIIPVQVEDPPPGYKYLWEVERVDAEQCEIRLAHINPGQIVKATFLMDEVPIEMLHFRCAMPNLTVKRIEENELSKLSMELSAAALATFPGGKIIGSALKALRTK